MTPTQPPAAPLSGATPLAPTPPGSSPLATPPLATPWPAGLPTPQDRQPAGPRRSAARRTTSRNLREQAYVGLRQRLMEGQFSFRDRLTEERLAALLGVSRTPVREALTRLASDGLVEKRDDGGYYPAEPDLDGLRDLYEIRVVLELRALERALESGVPHDPGLLEQLRDNWLALRSTPPEPDPSFVALDETFHLTLARASGNLELAHLLNAINARIRPVRMHDFLTEDRIHLTIDQHLGIVETVLAGDVPDAVRQLRNHVGESMEVVESRVTHAITQMVLHRGRSPR